MFKPSILFVFSSLLCIIGCTLDSTSTKVLNTHQGEYPILYELKADGVKEFPLDDNTPPGMDCTQYFEENDSSYYSYLNPYTNTIYIHDYVSGALLRTIKVEKEGSNGVGLVSGYHIINSDSIFVYNYGITELSLLDGNAKILSSYIMKDESQVVERSIPSAMLSTVMPLTMLDGTVYMIGCVMGEKENETKESRPVFSIKNLKEDKVSYQLGYPETYHNANWAGQSRFVYYCYNPDLNKFVVSFSASHELTTMTPEGKTEEHYAGSRYFGGIEPFDIKSGEEIDMERELEHFLTNPSYKGVFYDSYRKIYYRIAILPILDYDGNIREKRASQISIVILDENLKYIGETKIPHMTHSSKMIFITEDGLFVKKAANTEDKLVFTRFVLEKKAE